MFNSKFNLTLLLIFQIFFCTNLAFAEEKITSYNVYIKILEDSSLEVREQIDVIVEGVKIRRGIYRDFPTSYRDENGMQYLVGFNVEAASRDGGKEDYHTEQLDNGTRVYLGNKDRLLDHGLHSYVLNFKTNRQLGFFKDHDELYFNAIGTGWDYSIDRATVTVELPEYVGRENFKVEAYTGQRGSMEKSYNVTGITDRAVSFVTTRRLNSYEGFTIVVGWPKGIIKEPTALENAILLIKNSFLAILSVLFTILGLILNLFIWLTKGADPEKGVIYPRFSAPQGLAPYDLPFLVEMGYSPKCLSSAIVSSSIKGHLLIREVSGLLGFGTDFHIDKIDTTRSELDQVESAIVSDLFNSGENSIKCSSENHSEFEAAKATLTQYSGNKLEKYYKKNLIWVTPGLAINSAACAVAYSYSYDVLSIVTTCIAVLSTVFFFLLIKRYTPEGRRLLDEVEGYKMYLDTAEKGHYDNIEFPQLTQERFETHLPYAIALSVEANWMSAFKNALTISGQSPTSYHPTYYMGERSWDHSKFLSDTSSAFSSTIASSSTPPGSNTGFSGGGSGGSSGGGGGGGGGGW